MLHINHFSSSSFFEKEPWERATDLEKFIDYDISTMPVMDTSFEGLVHKVYEDCHLSRQITAEAKGWRTKQEENLKRCLKSVLWHLWLASKADDDHYVKISLASKCFTDTPNNPFKITRALSDVLKDMAKHDLIELKMGYYDKKEGKGKKTRFRATVACLNLLRTLPTYLSSQMNLPCPIQFKKKVGKEKEEVRLPTLPDDSNVRDAQKVTSEYNQLLFDSELHFLGVEKGIVPYRDKRGNRRIVDLSKRFLRSIIYVSEDGHYTYFRMHGAFWQNFSNAERRLIRIDGQEVVYLDYSAQILNIASSLQGAQIDGDAYDVKVLGVDMEYQKMRQLVKSAIVVFLNNSSRAEAYNALRGKIIDDYGGATIPLSLTNDSFQELEKALLEKHNFLESFLFAGRGSELFSVDAEIARGVIKKFLKKRSIVLPIHDGFIAKVSDKEFLYDAMSSAWSDRFGTEIVIAQEF